MKTIKTLLLLSLSLILFSCSDDDDDFKLAPDSLKQTSWKGEFIQEKDGKVIKKGNVGIEFTTVGGGVFSLIFEHDSSKEGVLSFTYTIDGKLLITQADNDDFRGNWFVVSSSKNALTLQKGTGSQGTVKDTMTLKKAI